MGKLKAEKQGAHSRAVYSVTFSRPTGRPSSRARATTRSKSGMQVWCPQTRARSLTYPKPERPHACGSIPGAQGREAERAQRRGAFRGLLARRQDHRLRLQRPDAQSLGCRCGRTDTLQPLAQLPILIASVLVAASLELKAEKESAQRLGVLRGLLSRRQDDCVRLRRQDDQSLGCRCRH